MIVVFSMGVQGLTRGMSGRSMIRRAAFIVFVGAALSACAGIGLHEPLRVSLAGLESLPAEGMEARFLARIRVHNPNDESIPYNGLSAELDLNGGASPAVSPTQRGRSPGSARACSICPSPFREPPSCARC